MTNEENGPEVCLSTPQKLQCPIGKMRCAKWKKMALREITELSKVLVGCEGEGGADACNGGDRTGARTQMRDAPQEFHRVTLLLQGVGVWGACPDQLEGYRFDLYCLALSGRGDDLAVDGEGGTRREQLHDAVALQIRIRYDLYTFDSCLLYTSPSPRDGLLSRMPSSA